MAVSRLSRVSTFPLVPLPAPEDVPPKVLLEREPDEDERRWELCPVLREFELELELELELLPDYPDAEDTLPNPPSALGSISGAVISRSSTL